MENAKIDVLCWPSKKVGQIYGEGFIVNLDKIKFIKDDKEYTADDLFDLIADKVIEKIKP